MRIHNFGLHLLCTIPKDKWRTLFRNMSFLSAARLHLDSKEKHTRLRHFCHKFPGCRA